MDSKGVSGEIGDEVPGVLPEPEAAAVFFPAVLAVRNNKVFVNFVQSYKHLFVSLCL